MLYPKYDTSDTDGDGLTDGHSGAVSLINYPYGVNVDGDGFVDGEIEMGSDPLVGDTDGDGMMDGYDPYATSMNCFVEKTVTVALPSIPETDFADGTGNPEYYDTLDIDPQLPANAASIKTVRVYGYVDDAIAINGNHAVWELGRWTTEPFDVDVTQWITDRRRGTFEIDVYDYIFEGWISNHVFFSGSADITYLEALSYDMTLEGESNMCLGGSIQMTASGGVLPYTWLSDNTSVATVDNQGLVSGLSPGVALISVVDSNGCQKDKAINLLSVDLNAAYSDQISGRECNALPGQNPMYMGARADNRGYLQIEATILPQQINNIGLVGVRHGTSILADEPIQTPRTPLDFAPAGDRQLYEVVAGCDLNTDGTLQNSEVSEVMTDQLMLLVQGDYNWSWGVLNTGAFFPGVGGDLLDAFLDDAVPSGANSTAATITSAVLTHPVGAQWTASCDAQTRRYTYAEGSAVSDSVETTGTVEDGLRTNLDPHQTEVQDYFTQNPTVNEHTFGSWNWAINNVEFGEIAHPSLHFAFGHVNIAGTVSVTVRRSDLEVTSIQYTGSFDDIYDFDYTGPYPSIHGATVQVGFPTSGTGGRVFWTRVEFERQTSSFDYDFH